MNTVDLLDRTITYALSITNEDEDNTIRRARILQMAQEVIEDIWYYRLWRFRKTSASVTVTAGVGVLPADFLELGKEGGVYDASGAGLDEVQWDVVAALRRSGNSSSTYLYAINDLDFTTGAPKLQLPSTSTGGTYTVYYEKKAPALFEMDQPSGVEGAVGLIDGLYHYKTTYVTANGESEGSRASAAITVTLKHITLTVDIGPPGTTSRKVYRTLNNGTAYRLVNTIANNTDTTFDDNTPDGALVGALIPINGSNEYSLERIPSAYHFRVIIPGLRWRVLDDIPDARAKTAFDLYDSGKNWMAAIERPRKSTLQKLPRAIPRGMW